MFRRIINLISLCSFWLTHPHPICFCSWIWFSVTSSKLRIVSRELSRELWGNKSHQGKGLFSCKRREIKYSFVWSIRLLPCFEHVYCFVLLLLLWLCQLHFRFSKSVQWFPRVSTTASRTSFRSINLHHRNRLIFFQLVPHVTRCSPNWITVNTLKS